MRYRIALGLSVWLLFAGGCLKPRPEQSPVSPLLSPLPIRAYLPAIASRPIDPRQGVSIRFGNCQDAATLKAGWVWDWGNAWCASYPGFAGGFYDEHGIGKVIDSPYVAGFNEPDLEGQANIAPCEGAILWRQIEISYTTKYLISPVPSQLNPQWLWEMVSCYEILNNGARPRFDAVQAHYYYWYGQPSLDEYIAQLRADMTAHGYAGKPIWLTEFGTCGSNVEPAVWMRTAIDWLQAQTDIARWAWYSARVSPTECQSNLIGADGLPNALGLAYMEAGQ